MISWYNKINPLWWWGDYDDGWCGRKDPGMQWWRDKHCPNGCTTLCAVKWMIRNPLHNFTFYVIGFADRDITTAGEYNIFAPLGWYFTHRILRDSFIKLPWVSYNGNKWQAYLGWRERGDFGLAFRRR